MQARTWRKQTILVELTVALLLIVVLAVSAGGSYPLAPREVLLHLLRGPIESDATSAVLWQIRMPRTLGAAFCGATLAATGAVFQTMFRNALAEPYVVGVSSGAAAGGALSIVVGVSGWADGLGMLLGAVGGGIAALFLVLALGGHRATRSDHLLLAGVVVGAMLGGLTTILLLVSGQDTNQVLRWLFGSFGESKWWQVFVCLVGTLASIVVYLVLGRALNAFALGEEAAFHVGIPVSRIRSGILIFGGAVSSITVGCFGIIGFLGLLAPHAARRLVGADLRWCVPASALCGATLLVAADWATQRLMPDRSLPVGALTIVLGAPFLLGLMRHRAN